MNSQSTLSVRLPREEKNRWKDYCRAQQKSTSTVTRMVIGHLLKKQSDSFQHGSQCEEQPDDTRARLELRLTQSELQIVRAVAQEAGASANQWVANLVRSYITRKPQLGMNELSTIAQSNARLLAVGRNLNQIARAVNRGETNGEQPLIPSGLADDIAAHVKDVSAVIRANLDRWSVTWR
jgi:hypothetical protein